MDKQLKILVAKLLGDWKALNKKLKIIIISSVAALLVIAVIIATVMSKPQYELLYSGGLTSSEAGQIYSAVQAKGVAAKVSGTDIYVKKGTADELRMQLAEESLPQGNISYDVYSSGNTWAETDKDKQIKQIQQVQNRLQSAIVTISGVKQAIVTIAQGNDDTYVLDTDKQPTTASVMLKLDNGFSLSKKQVSAIVQMVAHSVTGLTADNVSVTDEDGTPLTDSDTGLDATSDQLNMQSKYESTMKAKLMPMLKKIYGEGNVDAAVNADIDFSSVSTVTNTPTSGVPNSVSTSTQTTNNTSSGASGTTGVNGAQPTYPTASSQTSGTYTTQSNASTSYAVGSIQEQIQQKGGRLKNLTVSVILNTHNAAAANADPVTLKQMIANALGTTVNNVNISQLGFSTQPASTSAYSRGISLANVSTLGLLIIAGAALAISALLTLLIVLLKRRKRKRMEKAQAEMIAQLEAQKESEEAKPGKTAAQPIKSIEDTIKEAETNSFKKQIEDFADKKPELVAQILKNWLKD